MAIKRLLTRNKETGVERWFHHDGEKISIETKQDVAKVLDICGNIRNEFSGYKDKGDHHIHHVAHFTPVVIAQWLEDYGIDIFNPDHSDMVWKKLNDPDWRKIRTTEGWV
jgi:hypothetical protein